MGTKTFWSPPLGGTMNGDDLIKLREGMIRFDRFVAEHRAYMDRLATYFHRRSEWSRPPLGPEDLFQIGWIALWKAVGDYRWFCRHCRRTAASRVALTRHVSKRHPGQSPRPRKTLFEHVHGSVGRAMDHEMRRHTRRWKWGGDLPERWDLPVEPPQERQVEFRLLVAQTRSGLDPVRREVFDQLAVGAPLKAAPVPAAKAAAIRREIRDEIGARWRLEEIAL